MLDLARSEHGTKPAGGDGSSAPWEDSPLSHKSGPRLLVGRTTLGAVVLCVIALGGVGVSAAGAVATGQANPPASSLSQGGAPDVPPVSGAMPGNGAFNAVD